MERTCLPTLARVPEQTKAVVADVSSSEVPSEVSRCSRQHGGGWSCPRKGVVQHQVPFDVIVQLENARTLSSTVMLLAHDQHSTEHVFCE